jgi:hypothetical protein
LVSGLEDHELKNLSEAIWQEQDKRIRVKLERKEYPPFNEAELSLKKNRQMMDCITQYRERTGLSLRECKGVYDQTNV